jgi:tRNA-uridine 2-sulfurtransferase
LKALALFSGGLDSTLAMKVIINQGIEVIAIHVDTGFGSVGDRVTYMKRMCEHIGARFEILDLKEAYLEEVLFEPKYGYGNHFNPCIDCHGFMFRHTSKLLEKYGASFMISGEVVGQRPMSQTKDAMQRVQKLSQNEELVVRPLSAKLLPATKPELEGWIDRDKMLDFWGRGRSRQFEFAKEIGLENFEHPSGGCLLTDVQFTARLRDFVANDTLEVDDIDTLKIGRQLRLPDGAKLVIGRKQEENTILEQTNSKKYLKGRIVNATGPFVLLSKNASENDKKLAGDFIVTYGKTELDKDYEINFGEVIITGRRLENKEAMQPYLLM